MCQMCFQYMISMCEMYKLWMNGVCTISIIKLWDVKFVMMCGEVYKVLKNEMVTITKCDHVHQMISLDFEWIHWS